MLIIFNYKFLVKLTSTFLLIIGYLSCLGQKNYFQQQVNTTIEVELIDSNHFLHAKEKIVYINNSPFKLDTIFLHLWANAYKNVDTELNKQKLENGDVDLKYAYESERGYIDSLDFHVNGKKIQWNFFDNVIDIAFLILDKPLHSNDSIVIETPFRVKIPSGKFSRLGHVGQSYQITQWFPKPAVFDKNGWHTMSYLDQGEFYSEYGNYDVSITIPKNYILMATGDLQNDEEIDFLNKKAIETQKLIDNNQLPIRNSFGYKDLGFPKSSKETKTLRFIQNNVHDFAWFADKRYHVLKGSVKLPKSQRKVTSWALFTNNEAELWKKSIEYLNDATSYFSKWVGEYPYNHVTAVDGTISAGGGMEYPNITVIGSSGNSKSLETVIIHEVGHNWYYGILGNNERDNAWMDEGLNTYIEIRYMQEKYPDGYPVKKDASKNKSQNKILNIAFEEKQIHSMGYQFNASRNFDQRLQMGAQNYTSLNYGTMVYSKTGIGFHYLKDYIGEDLFDNIMNEYFEVWKFKHPSPSDLRTAFQDRCEKDLSWFFDGFIKTSKKTDYSIKKVKRINDKQYLIKIKNHTGFESPVPIQGIKIGIDTTIILSELWLDGFKSDTSIVYNILSLPSHFTIDRNLVTTDFNFFHHQSRSSGLFKFKKPIELKLVPIDITNNQVNHIYWAPLLAWNTYDKVMSGLAIHNKGIKTKKTEWLITPFYSFTNNSINGFGELNHYLNCDKFIKRIEFGYKLKSFSSRFENLPEFNNRWIKNEIYSEFRLKEKKLRYSPSQNIILRLININQEKHQISGNNIYPLEINNLKENFYYGQVNYSLKNKQILKPKSLSINYTYGFNKINVLSSFQLTANYRKNFNFNNDGFEARIFVGYNFINKGKNLLYNFNLKGRGSLGNDSNAINNDYLYENDYLGRNKHSPHFLGQQLTNTYGAFKINTNNNAGNILFASNFKLEIPKSPIGLFLDIGSFDERKGNSPDVPNFIILYNSGIYFNIKVQNKEILGIYLPIKYSDKISNEIGEVKLLQKITFVLNVNELNPFKIKKNFRP